MLPKGAIDLKLSTEKVLLAAVRRVADRAFVLRHLGNLEVVLAPRGDKSATLGELEAETGGLVEHLDGRRTLKEAAARTRLDEFEAAKIACALLFLGLASRAAAEPVFVTPDEDKTELDLGATASAAFVSEPEPALSLSGGASGTTGAFTMASAPDAPFFVPDAEPETEAEPPIPPPEPLRAAPPPPVAPPRPVAPAPSLIMPEPEPTVVMAAPPPAVVASSPEPEPTVVMAAPPPAIDRSPARSHPAGPALVYPPNKPSRARPEPSKHSPSRPSKDDLAALDVLLNPKAHEGPLAPLESGSRDESWSPQFNEGQGGWRRLSPAVMGGVGLLVLAAAGLWYYRQNPGMLPFGRASGRPLPSPTLRAAPPLTTLPAAATTLAATPVTTVAAVPTPRPTVTVPSPIAATPVTRPLATPPPTPAPATMLDQARNALRRGDYADAARGFATHLRRAPAGTATVQLLVACSSDTVQKAMTEVGGSELFILPVNYKGRDCFRMCWGLYPDASGAAVASRSLPEYFRRGGATPKVTPATDVLP